MEEKMELVPIEMIDRPAKISRETIDPEKVRELAESIRESGLLQPVVLRSQNGRYEIVAGDRRYLAHKLLGLKVIKAIIKDLDDQETVVIRGIENLQRVNLTPSEEGRLYLELKEEGGLSLREIARRTGRSGTTIGRYLNFAKCDDEVRMAVDKKEISLLCLETLQEIDDPEAFKYYFKMAASNGVAEKVARLWVDDYRKTKTGTYYTDGGGDSVIKVEDEPKPVFFTCEVCLGPVELRLFRNVGICPECAKMVKGMNRGKGKVGL